MPFTHHKLLKELILFCPLCEHEYTPVNLRTVEAAGDILLIHSKCPHCSGAILSLLYQDLLGMTVVGLVTDLDFQDALKFKDSAMVGEDDALALYELLN